MFERERDPLGAQPREPSHLGRKTRARVREDIACINGRIMVAIQSSFIRQLIQSDFSVPRRRFQDGERVIAGIHQMKPILRGLDSVGTREGEASSAVLIWIAPRSEEHTSELQSLMRISYAVFCLKTKNN